MQIPRKLQKLLEKWTNTKRPGENSTSEGLTCELCADDQFWIDNGYSEGERKLFCGKQGLDCPGFGDDD